MTPADITLTMFTLCNSLRVLAYVPQIAKAATDRSGGEAISFATWGLFLFSNLSATAYALVNKEDWTMASMFLGNAIGCAAIVLIAAWKRSRHRDQRGRVLAAALGTLPSAHGVAVRLVLASGRAQRCPGVRR